MTGNDIAALTVAAVLFALTAWLAAAETVVTRLGLVRALRLAEEHPQATRAERLVRLLEHRSSAQNVILVVTVVARVVMAGLVALALRNVAGAAGVVGGLGALALGSLVLAEVVPRTICLRHLERAGLLLARPLQVMITVTRPLSDLLVSIGRGLARRRDDVSGPFAPDDEIEELAAEHRDDQLEEGERAMIRSIFGLGDTLVREIMTPRPDMVTIVEGAALSGLVALVVERGFSRIPVHRGSRDEIVGVVHAKDILELLAGGDLEAEWSSLIRPSTFVPETKRVDDLLTELREEQVHQAIVVDEYGALVGLVTIEDILEEIVGEIVDEHDHELPLVEIIDDDRMRIDARLPVDELNELLPVELPSDGWDTVGGLVLGTLGHVPRPGESVELEGVILTTEEVQGRRVSKVLVQVARGAEE